MVTAARLENWAPDSWQRKRTLQQPTYRDPAALDRVIVALAKLPPIVVSWEIDFASRSGTTWRSSIPWANCQRCSPFEPNRLFRVSIGHRRSWPMVRMPSR